jgi:hypothetical protein
MKIVAGGFFALLLGVMSLSTSAAHADYCHHSYYHHHYVHHHYYHNTHYGYHY